MRFMMNVFAVAAASAVVVGGCAPRQAYQGDANTVASYRGSTLTAVIGAEHRVPTVLAAAEQAMRDRGYTIVSNASTEDAGTLIARPPRYNTYPRLMISSSTVAGGTKIELSYQPMGNEEVCRAALDATLKRLGL